MAALRIWLRKWVLRAAYRIFYLAPVRNRVVLASNRSAVLKGNLKAIYAALKSRDDTPPVVLQLHAAKRSVSGRLATLFHAIVAEYYLATSRVFVVDDYYFPIYVIKPKRGTTIIQTWHACGAFKKVGYSVLGKHFGASDALVRQVDIHSNYSHVLVASRESIRHYASAFRLPEQVFTSAIGIPRTDIFFDPERRTRAIERVRSRYRIPENRNVILYAPTFRGGSTHDATYQDLLDLEVMWRLCADKYVLLLRLHPFVARRVDVDPRLSGFVFDVSGFPDFNDLLLVSDVLVTDYSSAVFEFSLLERPMVFFAPDHAAYEMERGFYFDYATGVPGPVYETTADVAECIAQGGFDLERIRRFKAQAFDVADGQASWRFVEELVMPSAED